jgi:hypothetical protein
MKEAAKLGFGAAVAPPGGNDETAGLRIERTDHIADVVARIAALPGGRAGERRTNPESKRGSVRQGRSAPPVETEAEIEGAPF